MSAVLLTGTSKIRRRKPSAKSSALVWLRVKRSIQFMQYAHCMNCIERFTRSHTKAELFAEGFRRRILLVPVSNTADMLNSDQLTSRDYWTKLEHPELGRRLVYPGPFAKFSET